MEKVNIVCISDTHGRHNFVVPGGEDDILIHGGEFSILGGQQEVEAFLAWFRQHPHRLKIVIAGNHDLTFHEDYYEKHWNWWHKEKQDHRAIKHLLTNPELRTPAGGNIIYLEDASYTDPISGLTFYSSPWQPIFAKPRYWAFALPDDNNNATAEATWGKIPTGVDVLVTHGPPSGVLDMMRDNGPCGCRKLREALDRVRPRLHVFGHIHETHGQEMIPEMGTLCVNASICSYEYRPEQPAHVIEL